MSIMQTAIKNSIKKIEKAREYSLLEIEKLGIIPWAKDIRTIRKLVKRDIWEDNIFKAMIRGGGHATRYSIIGRNIIAYLQKNGEVMMEVMRVRVPKKVT